MESNLRILAAVMFTDMVGYTALMQSNEQKAKEYRDRHRQVLEKEILNARGQIIQYYGDGTLSVFGSVIEALKCAVKIQQELQQAPKIPLRIGIHTGDIVYTDDGVYGDAVNVASRIQSKSVAGGVLVSDKVFDEVKNHPEITASPIGIFELKNVNRPVELYALTNDNLAIPTQESIQSSLYDKRKSIAVLPFVNMSSDKENEYFSDGITEEIINALTTVEGLNITARTSSFALKGKNMDLREAGKMLGVTYILEGSVRRASDKVRVTAQLINANDGFHIFSEVYDRDMKDIFGIQDEISIKIANRLNEKLLKPPDKKSAEEPSIEQLNAYDLYLKGKYHLHEGSLMGTKKSIKYFEEAINLAPNVALPYTGLSMVYSHFSAYKMDNPEEAYRLAKEYATIAMELDDTLIESYLAMAHVTFINEWDFNKTHELVEKSLEIHPGSAEVHSWSSVLANVEGNPQQALIQAKLAVSLDPLSPMTCFVLGEAFYTNRMYKEAMEQFDKTIDNLPYFTQAFILKGRCLLTMQKLDEALELFKRIPYDENKYTTHWGAVGYIYSMKGEINKVKECLEKIKHQDKAGICTLLNWSYAILYLALGQMDLMYHYLEESLKEKSATLLFIKVDPIFDAFREDKRFIALLDKYFI